MSEVPASVAVPDPDNVRVQYVTGVATHRISKYTLAMTLVTDRMALTLSDGKPQRDLIIVGRLRFDLDMARQIRDQLDAHLKMLTAQENKQQPN
jgi:hypothetical protein